MSMENQKERTHLKGASEFKAMKLIEANGKIVGGCFVYNTGWSDFKIAQEMGCNEAAIARRRREVFGSLYRVSVGNDAEMKTVVSDIESLKSQNQANRVDIYRMSQRIEALDVVSDIESLKSQNQANRVDICRMSQRIEALEKSLNLLLTASETS